MRKVLGAMSFSVFAVICAYLGTATSHADTASADSQYLALLDRDNITSPNGGVTNLINVGHWICMQRMGGASESSVESFVYQRSQLPAADSANLVRDAEQVYCPAFLGGSGGENV